MWVISKALAILTVAGGLVLSGNAAQAAPEMAPAVSMGWDELSWVYGPYIDLDRVDQGAVAAGAGAGVAAVICTQTDGWACPSAAVVVTTAAFYIAVNGYCPDRLRIYPNPWFVPVRCVS